jgi:hypothetical protein
VAVPPDLVIGVITSLMVVSLVVPALPVLIRAGNLRYLIRGLAVVLLVLAVVALLSFPYGPATPKRLIAQHTYHRPVQIIRKPAADGERDIRAARIAEMIEKFNKEDRSGKADADDSFVLLGSFDYLPAEMVFSGLPSPPSFKKAEDILYNFLPVYPFQVPLISSLHPPPGLLLAHVSWRAAFHERRAVAGDGASRQGTLLLGQHGASNPPRGEGRGRPYPPLFPCTSVHHLTYNSVPSIHGHPDPGHVL